MHSIITIVDVKICIIPKSKRHALKYSRFSPYRAVNTLHLGYTNQSVNLYREIIDVCSEIHTKHINIQSVPRSKHSLSVIQTSQLMSYREIMAICSEIHTKHINIQSVPRSKHNPSRLYKPVS